MKTKIFLNLIQEEVVKTYKNKKEVQISILNAKILKMMVDLKKTDQYHLLQVIQSQFLTNAIKILINLKTVQIWVKIKTMEITKVNKTQKNKHISKIPKVVKYL